MRKSTVVLSSILCDCCEKAITKKEAQRHHLIPKKLRDCNADNIKTILLCDSCHLSFHKLVNFNDVSGHSKQYFIKKYLEYRVSYQIEREAYIKFINILEEQRNAKDRDSD